MATMSPNDPVLQMASRLLAAMLTRHDTAVYDANWTEGRRAPMVTKAVELARELYDEVARTQVIERRASGAGTWTIDEEATS
jgi:hypothetical protein